jgi:hypothetical protein
MDDELRPDSRARQIQALKNGFLTILNPEQLRQVTEKLVALALDGSIPAAKLLLDRAFDRHMSDGQTQKKKGATIEERHASAVEKFARNHKSD